MAGGTNGRKKARSADAAKKEILKETAGRYSPLARPTRFPYAVFPDRAGREHTACSNPEHERR
jgi:hypothetical protein